MYKELEKFLPILNPQHQISKQSREIIFGHQAIDIHLHNFKIPYIHHAKQINKFAFNIEFLYSIPLTII